MRLRGVWIVMLMALFTSVAALAQDSCTLTVNQALNQIGDACRDLDRNTACYGHDYVVGDFAEEVNVFNFQSPADVLQLSLVNSLESSPYDEALNKWGVAVLNVQANVPNTLPGQAVVFLLLGDTRVDNTSQNEDQPFEAFYFSTGIGQSSCKDAPTTLAIRSPENITINLTVNGMDITLGSMITLTDNQDQTLTITVHEGRMGIPASGVSVAAGQAIDLTIDDAHTIIEEGEPREATQDELDLGGAVGDVYDELFPEGDGDGTYTVVPGDTLFGIAERFDTCVRKLVEANDLTDEQIQNILVGQTLIIPDGVGCRGPGDGLPEATAEPTQEPALPTEEPTPDVTAEPTQDVTVEPLSDVTLEVVPATEELVLYDCSALSAVSPLDGLFLGPMRFAWSGVSWATEYRIVVKGDGTPLTSYGVAAPSTVLSADLTNLDGSYDLYSWDVEAYAGKEFICSVSSGSMQPEFSF